MATENLQIPDIAASQNQKEVTANAAHNLLDRAVNNRATKAISGDTSFTATETRENFVIELTGTPGAPHTINMPDTKVRMLVVVNNTDDVMTIRNSAGGGTGQPAIGVGDASSFHYDGTNFLEVLTAPALTFLDLTDTPSSYSGDALKILRVNSGGNAVEFGSVEGLQDGTPGFLTRNELLHITHEEADGVSGGASVTNTWNTRPINAVKVNEISGASLATNQITLPAGTYYIEAQSYVFEANRNKLRLRNITDSTSILIGINGFASVPDNDNQIASLRGRFVLTATKTLEIQHWTESGFAISGLGSITNDTEVEVYADITIWKDAGAAAKPPVRVASTVNGTLATAFENGDSMDGITLATDDRILLKDQSTGAENGIYVVKATGAPDRASDLDANEDVGLGVTIPVLAGTLNGRSVWMHTAGTDIGTDTLTFDKIPVSKQIAPPTATDTATLTDAQMLGGILEGTPTGAATYTTRTGTEIEAALSASIATDDSFELTIINLGATATDITMAGGTGVTFVGDVFIENSTDKAVSGVSHATFRFRRSAANTFIAYRIG